jgi:signal peptidase
VRRLTLLGLRLVLVVIAAATALLVWPMLTGQPSRVIIVSGHSMEPTFHTGDLLLAWPSSEYHVGDVVPYRIPADEPGAGGMVIHRLVGHDRAGYLMKGDNNAAPDMWRPRHGDAVGRTILLVPKVGVLLAWIRQPLILAALAAGVVTTLLMLRKPAATDDVETVDLRDPAEDSPLVGWQLDDITLCFAAPSDDGAALTLSGWQ